MDFSLEAIDLSLRLEDEEHYRDRLKSAQKNLAHLQKACYHNGHPVIIVLEGWDASGKGGAIRRMTEKLDPRSCTVYPIAAPSPEETAEHYLQRFWRRVPARGHIAIFDRSWYGRVLVERVEELATRQQWLRAYDEINNFEQLLTDDGFILIKLFLHISQEEQCKRYLERLDNPEKHWKLSEEDLRNRLKAEDYRLAYEDMINRTHCDQAPWITVAGEHKWFARVFILETLCSVISSQIDTSIPRYSDEEIAQMKGLLNKD